MTANTVGQAFQPVSVSTVQPFQLETIREVPLAPKQKGTHMATNALDSLDCAARFSDN
jgi:hypothetical protein